MNQLIHANCHFLMGRHKEAFDAYMDIVKASPDAIAASNIGYMYHRGIAVIRNYGKALAYYNAAKEEDGGVSFFNMALMYLRGQGVAIDFKKAIELMKLSADHSCADARLYLGLAYILGYAYDPVDIECLSLIPFYRVIYRDESQPLLDGEGYDPSLEDKRYEAITADENEAVEMYSLLSVEHDDDPYVEKQCAAAEFMLGKAYIEGLGNLYNPKLGYRKIYNAAIYLDSAEAAQFLIANKNIAKKYKINVDKIELLATHGYFRPTMGNLGTPYSHRVPLLLPEEN